MRPSLLPLFALLAILLLVATPSLGIKKKLSEKELGEIEDQWMEDEVEDEGQRRTHAAADGCPGRARDGNRTG